VFAGPNESAEPNPCLGFDGDQIDEVAGLAMVIAGLPGRIDPISGPGPGISIPRFGPTKQPSHRHLATVCGHFALVEYTNVMGRSALTAQCARCQAEFMDSTTPNFAGLAAAMIERGEHAAAADTIATMFSANPNDPEAHRMWGRLLLAKGQYPNAVEAFRQASSLAMIHAGLRYELAHALATLAANQSVHFRDATLGEAHAVATDAVRLDPSSTQAMALLESIDEQRRMDTLDTTDHTPQVMLARTTPVRQYQMPTTTQRMANNYAIWWATITLAFFAFLILRLI
jgi:tetratricopeptide (TPR) repeat protein